MKPAHQFRTNNASVDKFIFWPEITYFVHPTILVGRFSSIIQPFQKGKLSFMVLYGDIIWHIRLVVRFFGRFHRTWNNDTKGFKSTCPFPWPLSFSKGGNVPPVAWAGGQRVVLPPKEQRSSDADLLCGWAWIFP
jgi:hypothetical protein